jgi:uncharacterized membrane protein YphA (DoxX/SURF4 family)
MSIALWIIAGLLAAVFLAGGVTKLVLSKDRMAAMRSGAFVEDFSPAALKVIGGLEVLASAGLILPAALDIAPVLVPIAAVGLVLLMIGAIVTHLRRSEKAAVLAPAAYLAMAAFVAWGRFGPEAFTM